MGALPPPFPPMATYGCTVLPVSFEFSVIESNMKREILHVFLCSALEVFFIIVFMAKLYVFNKSTVSKTVFISGYFVFSSFLRSFAARETRDTKTVNQFLFPFLRASINDNYKKIFRQLT